MSDGDRSSATRITGESGGLSSSSSVSASRRNTRPSQVLQIDRTLVQQRIAQACHVLCPLVDRLTPRPSGAVAGLDALMRGIDQIRVVEEFLMGTKDGRPGGAAALLGLVVKLLQLCLGRLDRLVQANRLACLHRWR